MNQIFVLALVLLTGCLEQVPEKEHDWKFVKQPDGQLVGVWTMCSYSDGSHTYQMNACSDIFFNLYGLGKVTTGGNEKETFHWSSHQSKVKIFGKARQSIFVDNSYTVSLDTIQNRVELTLIGAKASIYLSRTIVDGK